MTRLVITRDAGTCKADLASLRGAGEDFSAPGTVFLAFQGRNVGAAPRVESAGSLFYPLAGGRYEAVGIGASIRYYQSAWGRALLAYACSLLTPGGRLVLAAAPGTRAQGHWDRAALADFLGAGVASPHWPPWGARPLAVRDPRPPVKPPSVLTWYLDGAKELLAAALAGKTDAAQALARLPDAAGELVASLPPALSDEIAQQAYYVGGMAYKAAAVARLAQAMRAGPARSHLDIGAGYGLLGLELMAEPALGVERAVAVDHSDLNRRLASIAAQAPAAAPGRFRFVVSTAQDYEPDERHDLVTFIGSLLYVPRPLRATVLERAYAALAPGGVLVVHENIKAPSYARDYDVMFEPDELDALLAPLGRLRYFRSTGAMTEASRGEVARSTVFRAVARPL